MRKIYFSLLFLLGVNLNAQPPQSYCQQFDGNQFFMSNSLTTLNLDSSFTIEAWVNLNLASPYGVIAGKVNNPRGSDPYQNYVLAFDSTGLKPEFVQTTGAPGSYTTATSPTNISLGTWTHIAATLGNGIMHLYINGILVATQNSPGATNADPNVPFAIGSGATNAFQTTCCGVIGYIKQVRVWDVARTATEINAAKDSNLLGNEANLLACYPMNENTGQLLIDSSQNSFNLYRGTTVNAESQDPTAVYENNLVPIFSYTTINIPDTIDNSINYEELYVVDFDHDNNLDFLATTLKFPPTIPATYNPIIAYKNNGGLNFASANPFSGDANVVHPRDYTVGDFNNDGRSDIFIIDHGTDTNPFPGNVNKLFLQNASGQLVNTPGNIPSLSDFSHHTASADIDNDGDLDLYVCNVYGQNNIGPYFLINNGSGNFTFNNTNFPAAIANLTLKYLSSRFADIDNDNDKDLILGGSDDIGLAKDLILLNNGSGVFSPGLPLPNRYGDATWGTVNITTADFNNDGWVDLLMNTLQMYQTCHLQLLLNNHDGTFTDATSNLPQSWESNNTWVKWVETGDFNNDGNIDIVCIKHVGANPKLFFNNGNAVFQDASYKLTPDVTSVCSIRAADYNNDGVKEIAFLDLNNKIVIAKVINNYTLDSSISIPNQSENSLSIYPNPLQDNLSISLPEGESFVSMTIYDMLGKELTQFKCKEESYSLSFLPKGSYVAKILTDKKNYSKILIKK